MIFLTASSYDVHLCWRVTIARRSGGIADRVKFEAYFGLLGLRGHTAKNTLMNTLFRSVAI